MRTTEKADHCTGAADHGPPRGRRGAFAVVLAAVALAALAVILNSTVAAAGAPRPFFGLRPALTGTTTLRPGHFTYALPAGGHVHDAATVYNFTHTPLVLSVYTANLLTTTEGGFAPGEPGQRTIGATSWVRLAQNTLHLPPNAQQQDHFSVNVPKGTPPGDYLSTVVAAPLTTPKMANGLTVVPRVALVVQITVIGRAFPRLRIGPLLVSGGGAKRELKIEVSNIGNVLVTLNGVVQIGTGPGRTSLSLGPPDAYVLPSGRATLTATWSNVPLFGRPTLRAIVSDAVSGQRVRSYETHPIELLIAPWPMLGAGFASIVSLLAILFFTRRRRSAVRRRRLARNARHARGRHNAVRVSRDREWREPVGSSSSNPN